MCCVIIVNYPLKAFRTQLVLPEDFTTMDLSLLIFEGFEIFTGKSQMRRHSHNSLTTYYLCLISQMKLYK
jgi:hypothetical protein